MHTKDSDIRTDRRLRDKETAGLTNTHRTHTETGGLTDTDTQRDRRTDEHTEKQADTQRQTD